MGDGIGHKVADYCKIDDAECFLLVLSTPVLCLTFVLAVISSCVPFGRLKVSRWCCSL